MKIRTNFVSNSSSSSFIVLVKSEEKCPHCNNLGMAETLKTNIYKLLGEHSSKAYFSNSAECYVNNIKHELEIDKKELNYLKDSLDIIKKNLEDKNAIELAVSILNALEADRAWNKTLGKRFCQIAGDPLIFINSKAEGLERNIENRQELIDDKEELLKGIEPYNQKDWSILSFTIDNWNLSDISTLIEKSGAVLLRKTTY
jgi:hypothetical protein